jgi:hypothetical protein
MSFTEGAENEPSYFAFSVTLRVHGKDMPFDEITSRLGVTPTHQHREGERGRPKARPYPTDAWHFTAPLSEEEELTNHLRALWKLVEPHVDYLLSLNAKVDVFCGYRSNNGSAGFQVESDALEIFSALQVPFSVSVIVDSWLEQCLDQPTLQ